MTLKNRGFTLVELLITLAIMSVIVLTVSSIYIKVAKINREQAELQSLRTSCRLHTKEINTLILQGFQIEQGPIVINDVSHSSSSSKIIISLISLDASNNYRYQVGDVPYLDYAIYWTSGGDLYEQIYAANSDQTKRKTVAAHKIDSGASLAFTYTPSLASAKSVTTNLTLSRDIPGKTLSSNYELTAIMRNKE